MIELLSNSTLGMAHCKHLSDAVIQFIKGWLLCIQSRTSRGGVQLHFCTWPPDFCRMYMYKNAQECTKYVFSCLEVPWIDLLAVANLQ